MPDSSPLRHVQIETTTTCNQRCNFCPVSVEKRPKANLPLEQFTALMADLKDYPLESVYLNGFNEPTFDKTLPDQVAIVFKTGFPVHLNSNASGLEPALTDKLLAAGISAFTINLSTLDPERYQATRGSRDLPKVITNLEYLLSKIDGVRVEILMLGSLDARHAADIRALCDHFASLGATMLICPTADYAVGLTQVLPERIHHTALRGCSGQRHTKWMHFTPTGHAILCCQDYTEQYRISPIPHLSPEELLASDRFAQLRRWVEGTEEAPEDFICRSCIYAIGTEPYEDKIRRLFCQQCELPAQLGVKESCQRCVVNDCTRMSDLLNEPMTASV